MMSRIIFHPDEEALIAYLASMPHTLDERREIEQHLAACDRCVAMLAVAHARLAVGDEVAVTLPPGLLERAQRLAARIEAPAVPAVDPHPVARARPQPAGWLAGIRQRIEIWSRLPVLVPVSFAVGVTIMVMVDQLRPTQVLEPARRSITLEPAQLVTTGATVVRAEPHAQAAIVATLARGEVVTVDQEEREWYRARLADGRQGWVDHQAFE
jgi:hypothetical protein